MTRNEYLLLNKDATYHTLLMPFYEAHSKLRTRFTGRISKAVDFFNENKTLLCKCSNGYEVTALTLLLEFGKPPGSEFHIFTEFSIENHPEFKEIQKLRGITAARFDFKAMNVKVEKMRQLIINAEEAYGWVKNSIDKTIQYQESSQPIMSRGNICRAFHPVDSLPTDLRPGDKISLLNPRKNISLEYTISMVYKNDDGYQVKGPNNEILHIMDSLDYEDIYYELTPENRLCFGMSWHMKKYSYI